MSVRMILQSLLLGMVGLDVGLNTLAAQTLAPEGSEYPIVGSYLGDQTLPAASYSANRGFLVWQDNSLGGKGSSIVARQLSSGFSAHLSGAFRVNTLVDLNHVRPVVTLLSAGNVTFAWQVGLPGHGSVYARFMGPNGAFYGTEVKISQPGVDSVDPAVGALPDGRVMIVWSASGPDGDMLGVFGQVYSGLGQAAGEIFQINTLSTFNQRNAALTVGPDGRVLVVWVSEQQRSIGTTSRPFSSTDIQGRYLDAAGVPLGNEFRINTEDRLCSNPTANVTASGKFGIVWNQRASVAADGWDIMGTWYSEGGARTAGPILVNSTTVGNQIVPSISSIGERQLVAWTSGRGVKPEKSSIYGQAFREGVKTGLQFKVNTWTSGNQSQPTVISDSLTKFTVVWSSYVGERGFDLHAQRYSMSGGLAKPEAPFVSNLGSGTLQATWAPVQGYPLRGYEIAFDQGNPTALQKTLYTKKGLEPATTHSFRLRYLLANGDASPWSDESTGKTYGEDNNGDLVPDDWQQRYWGADSSKWPSTAADSDGDGATNAREFLAGTDPNDKTSVLRQTVQRKGLGLQLIWNTVPGAVYQVQISSNENLGQWSSVGEPRLARSTSDFIVFHQEGRGALYRVIRPQ